MYLSIPLLSNGFYAIKIHPVPTSQQIFLQCPALLEIDGKNLQTGLISESPHNATVNMSLPKSHIPAASEHPFLTILFVKTRIYHQLK